MTEGANVGALTAQINLDARELDKGASQASRALGRLKAGEEILKGLNFQLGNFANAARGVERAAGSLAGIAAQLRQIGSAAKSLKSLAEIGPDLAKGGAALSAFTTHLQALGAARPALSGIKQDLREMSAAAGSLRVPTPRAPATSKFELPRGAGIPFGPTPLAEVRSVREIPARPRFELPRGTAGTPLGAIPQEQRLIDQARTGRAMTLPPGHPVMAMRKEIEASNQSLRQTLSFQAQLLHLQGNSVAALRIEQGLALQGVKTAQERNAIQALYTERIKQASQPIHEQAQSVSRIVGMLQRAAAAYILFKTGQFFADIIQASVSLEGMPVTFKAITGSASQAGKEMAFIRSESDRLGQQFLVMGDAWKGFLGGAQGALGLENARKVFVSVSEAATVLRLNNEATSKTFLALQQMASKGVISMEELRGQMGEHLPMAIELFAAGLGKGTQELNKMIKRGEVLPLDLLKFADQLSRKFGREVPEAAQGSQAALNRFSNAVLEAKIAVGQGGFLEAAISGIKRLTEELRKPEMIEGLKALGSLAGTTTTIVFTVAQGALGFLRFLGSAGDLLAEGGARAIEFFQKRPEVELAPRSRFLESTGQIGRLRAARAQLEDERRKLREVPAFAESFISDIRKPQIVAPIDEKAARAAQMSLECTLDLRQELLRLQKKGIEALEVEREHDLASARRRKALPPELSAINALHAERIRLFQVETEMEAGGIRAAAGDPFPEIYAQERSLRKIQAERFGDQQGIVDVLDEELGLLREQSAILAGDPGSLEKRLGVETQINEILGKRNDLLENLRLIANPPTAPTAQFLEAERGRAEAFGETMLSQARFQFGRGQIGRGDLLGQLQAAQGRAEEEWIARPTNENLRKMLALQQEQADLTVDIWFEAQNAIANNWMQVVEGAENMGEALLGVFKDIGRNISRILIQDVSQGMVNALKKSLSGVKGQGSGGILQSILGIFRGGGQAPTGGGSGGILQSILGIFRGGGQARGEISPNVAAPPPAGAQPAPNAPITTPGGGGMGGLGMGIAAIATIAGQAIGGRAGGAISGAASGAMLGSMILPGIGTVVGGVIGGIAGAFGGGKKKEKDLVRAAIRSWFSSEFLPAIRELQEMGFAGGPFVGHSQSSAAIRALGWGRGIPQQALGWMKEAGNSLRDTFASALEAGFKANSAEAGFQRFLRNLKKGVADFVLEGLIEAALRSKAMTRLLAPLFEIIPTTLTQIRRGEAFQPAAFQEQIMGAWRAIQPALSNLQPMFEALFGAAREFQGIGRSQGALWASIPAQFLNPAPAGQAIPGGATTPGRGGTTTVPVTIYATVNSPMDAQRMGREAADEIERELRRIG